ncbi:hypothetical protein [Mesorhizobium sp.]|uniref:hypothetical protein n=1 Tax=Mesorhizobium sp. TaxID=1871066 RepID=UPI00257E3DE3|nr:hypothetical protein [Mesorhizobium sp.]
MRKSVDMKMGSDWRRLAGEHGLAKSAGQSAGNARRESRRQAFSVLQHKTLVSRIAKKLFHGVAHINVLTFRQLRLPGAALPSPLLWEKEEGASNHLEHK